MQRYCVCVCAHVNLHWIHIRVCMRACILGVLLGHLQIPFTLRLQGSACWLKTQNFLRYWTIESQVLGSNKGPRKCTEACLAASNMWSQLWRTLGLWRQGHWELHRTVCLSWELRDSKLPAWPQLSPFKSWVITGFIVITACFLKGQASQGSNPPVSAHINGLIGLFSPSQNAGLSLTEMLSPQSPSRLNTREMHDVSAKWSRHYPSLSLSLIHIVVIPVFFFLPSFFFPVSLHHDVLLFVAPTRRELQQGFNLQA